MLCPPGIAEQAQLQIGSARLHACLCGLTMHLLKTIWILQIAAY